MEAAEIALAGVREEAKVGQRTTLDVLNAQQTLLNARVQLVTAEHDQVVDSYTLAVGDRPAVDPDSRARGRRNTTRAFTSIRSRTSGSACARRTGAEYRRRRLARLAAMFAGLGAAESCATRGSS